MARRSDERDAARAEYIARMEKDGEVNLRQLADDLHLKYDTVRRWKAKDGWGPPAPRKPGGQPGNKNAVGNPGGGAPVGNENAMKDGAYATIFFDKLTPEEKQIVENAPRNSTELTSHEIGVLLLREKYILDKIKEYQALPPDQMITSSVMDMRVPGGRGKRKRDGANQQIGMYQKETPAQRILQLQEALNKIHGRILSAAAQMQKNEMDKLHLETEQQRLELLRIRATGEIGEPGTVTKMLYTSKAVGEWLGITDRQVRNLRDQGVLSEVRPGVFDMKVCVRQYLNFKIGNKDDQARLVAARAEREETRGKIEKMRMEEAQGDLHRTEDVERALKTIFANFKNRLETIPTKYASTMAQLTDPAEAHDILQKAVQEALVELSDPEIALAAPAGEEPEDEQEE